jgi:hypothetical protein
LRMGGRSSCTCTEHYNGTGWTVGGALSQGRYRISSTGLQNSGLVVGGMAGPATVDPTEEYDGSSWSTGTSLTVAANNPKSAGTQNDAIVFGGTSPFNACTEHYDGSAWSAGGTSITGKTYAAGTGISTSALSFAGHVSPAAVICTEEYNAPYTSTGSFGRIISNNFTGDASGISASLYSGTGAISSSAQIATDISGSFIRGFNFGVTADDLYVGVSGSATTHGHSSCTSRYTS